MKHNLLDFLSVHYLRENGIKTRVIHCRRIKEIDLKKMEFVYPLVPMFEIREQKLQNFLLPRGGKTVVEVTTKDGKNFSVEANCSEKDVFVRKEGIRKCLGRLVSVFKKNDIKI